MSALMTARRIESSLCLTTPFQPAHCVAQGKQNIEILQRIVGPTWAAVLASLASEASSPLLVNQ